MEYKRCFAKVSLDAVASNLRLIKSAAGKGKKLLTVVKADAYGHGSVPVAKAAEEITDLYGVACIDEAKELRNAGILKPVLILGYTSPSQYEQLILNGISAAIYDLSDAQKLSSAAVKLHKPASLHIAVDTGMTRIGFRCTQNSADQIREIFKLPGLRVDGIFTHLSCADMGDPDSVSYTKMQLAEFDSLLCMLKATSIEIPFKHAYNSAGLIRFENEQLNVVRSGLITYGMYPSDYIKEMLPGLTPALSWYAHVIHIAEAEEGRGVSYGATYHTRGPSTRIATVCAGYADGYPRSLSNIGSVIIRGQLAPIIGRVCMDQFMVDISNIENVKKEDLVTLIGKDGSFAILADDIAHFDNTINYEVTCRISPRVERIY